MRSHLGESHEPKSFIFALLLITFIQEASLFYGDGPLFSQIINILFENPGLFSDVILPHTSGDLGRVDQIIPRLTQEGYAVYSPDFITPFGLTPQTRQKTFHEFKTSIVKVLFVVVEARRKDPKIDNKNLFAVGYSNVVFWVCYLAETRQINEGVASSGSI